MKAGSRSDRPRRDDVRSRPWAGNAVPACAVHACLVESASLHHGKRFYLCILGSGCSKTWIDDSVADELIQRVAP